MERVDSINKQPFIRSEVAIGKSRAKIAIENVFPHLAPEMVVLFFMEIARALSTIMQLGIFSVFVGYLKIIKDTEGSVSFYDVSFEPEWAGMLSTSKNFLSTAPWAVIFPAIAFFISVLGFNLFGEGLRSILQRSDSLFIPRVRKLLSFDVKYIWSSFSRKSRVISVVLVATIVISSSMLLIFSQKGKPIEIINSYIPEYESVVIGTNEAYSTASIISTKMEELGLVPLYDDNFMNAYDIPPISLILEQDLKLGNLNNYTAGKDYTILDSPDGNFSGDIYDLTKEDLFSMNDFSKLDGHFVMIDKAYYNDAAISYFVRRLDTIASVKGVLLVARKEEAIFDIYSGRTSETLHVLISRQMAEEIKEMENPEIEVSLTSKALGETGINVVGMYEGTDDLLKEEAIMIGLPYNYTDQGEKQVVGFGLQLMEEICQSSRHGRSLIFVFIDGTDKSMISGINALADDYPYSESKTKLFINLLDLNESGFDDLIFSDSQSPFTRQYAWSMGRQLEAYIKKTGIGIIEANSIFFGDQHYFTDDATYNTIFMGSGVATIIIAADEEGDRNHSLGDLGRILVDTINDNNY